MKADRNVKVGFNIPSHEKIAHAPSYEDEVTTIHDDEHAQQRGFRGNLVGGGFLLGYTLQMLYRYFGADWMKHGAIEVSYIGGGAINGDRIEGNGVITEKKEEDSGVRLFLDVWLDNTATGKKILVGKASCRVH
ncbi:hypothetical protein ACFLZM_01950 [Thermodesulfobacteriota bacterium]